MAECADANRSLRLPLLALAAVQRRLARETNSLDEKLHRYATADQLERLQDATTEQEAGCQSDLTQSN